MAVARETIGMKADRATIPSRLKNSSDILPGSGRICVPKIIAGQFQLYGTVSRRDFESTGSRTTSDRPHALAQ